MYKLGFRSLSVFPAEAVSKLVFRLLCAATAVPGVAWALSRALAPTDPVLRVKTLGLDFAGPLGVASGFDKDALGPDSIGALGFGFVQVGGVTAHPQPGNPKPRLFRLTRDQALINRMGFNNEGAAVVAARLARRRQRPLIVGIDITRSRSVANSEAVADYVLSAEALAPVVDFLVVNVSSPNTPGLRDLQAVESLRPILVAVREALDRSSPRRLPLLLKIAPDLADSDIDAIADLALELRLDGIVATNTTVSRAGLRTDPDQVAAIGAGGLSGPPLKARAVEVVRRLRARAGDRLVLIGVGGIETADDAWEFVRAGATLLQSYTGFIYGGPLWPRGIHRGLAAHVRQAGLTSISQAVGVGSQERPVSGQPDHG